jgi:hypothetical protein
METDWKSTIFVLVLKAGTTRFTTSNFSIDIATT